MEVTVFCNHVLLHRRCYDFGMLAPQTRIVLVRSTQIFTGILLVVAALGIWSNFDALRLGIMVGFFVLATLAFLMDYRWLGISGVALALLFNPLTPLHLPRHIWVVLDLLSLAGMIYFTYWATNAYKKGARFERYVTTLFPEPEFVIHDRTRDNAKFLDRHVESDGCPDLVFRNKKTGKLFAVECKWRGKWAYNKNGGLGIWWKPYQAERYAAYGKESGMPVFVAFGIGGTPEKPKEVYFLEADRLHYLFLNQSLIKSGQTAPQL